MNGETPTHREWRCCEKGQNGIVRTYSVSGNPVLNPAAPTLPEHVP